MSSGRRQALRAGQKKRVAIHAQTGGSCSSGKRRYVSGLDAKLDLARIVRWSEASKRPKRAYECDLCKGWHLTSQSLGRYERGLGR